MNALFLLQGIGMIVVGLIAVLYWRRLSRVPAVFFVWGSLSWMAAMVLKSVAASGTPQIITRLRAVAPDHISEPILWLYIGLLTGVFECGVSLLIIYLIKRVRSASWREAVGFGVGFGALEALILGVYSFIIVLLLIVIPDQLPPELVALADTRNASLLAVPLPIVERAIVILLHAFSSILIIYAVQKKEWIWFWISFVYKTALDTIAGFIQITYGVQNLTYAKAWLVELALIPFGLVGLWGLITFRNRWPPVGRRHVGPAVPGNEALDVTARMT